MRYIFTCEEKYARDTQHNTNTHTHTHTHIRKNVCVCARARDTELNIQPKTYEYKDVINRETKRVYVFIEVLFM